MSVRARLPIAVGIVGIALPLLPGCSQQPGAVPAVVVAGYDLSAPRRSFALPHRLREVSAIVAVDADTIACLQDEVGSVFLFDLPGERVRARLQFGPAGDYEGLARVGDAFWVLRSDGRLFELAPDQGELAIARTIDVAAPQREFEGLCWDAHNRLLVVAPKSVAKAAGDRDDRPLYAVDPSTGSTLERPYAVVDRAQVERVAEAAGVVWVGERDAARARSRLRMAEVAVHPSTGDIWLLSAVDRALIVVARSGEVRGVHVFPVAVLPQPEGATFLSDGSLAIASEGGGGVAVVRVFGVR